MPKKSPLISLLVFCLTVSVAVCAPIEVELRLVPHDRPEETVAKLEKQEPIVNPVATPQGVKMQKIGVNVECWARNVRLDGEPVFERYHKGKYIGRRPVARVQLKPGKHTIWPGNHVFTVKEDSTLSTESQELAIADGVVRIKTYPVTVRAYRANPPEGDLPMSMRVAPLPDMTVREAADAAAAREKGKRGKPRELLPVFEDFAPLTVWLPAHTTGQGYVIHPVGLTFHLNAKGVMPGAGEGQTVEGLRAAPSRLEIPLYGYPVRGEEKCTVVIPGVERLEWSRKSGTRHVRWYPRTRPYEFRVSEAGPAIEVPGNLQDYPVKAMSVDFAGGAADTQRGLVAELTGQHLTAGESFRARVRAVDPRVPQKAAEKLHSAERREGRAHNALRETTRAVRKAEKALAEARKKEEADPEEIEVLQQQLDATREEVAAAKKELEGATKAREAAEAHLENVEGQNRLADAPVYARLRRYGREQWQDLPVVRGDSGDVEIAAPEVKGDVYTLRLGVKSSDGGDPIYADLNITIARSRAYGIGTFTQRGRTAFYRGEPFWIGVGLTSAENPIPAGTSVALSLEDEDGRRLTLLKTRTEDVIEGRETMIVRLDGDRTLSLASGDYTVEAKVGSITARSRFLHIVEPDPETHFTNLLNGKYNVMGGHGYYEQLLHDGKGARSLVQGMVGAGYNSFMGMSYDFNRVNRPNVGLEQLVRERPELGPWESYYQPSGRDRFMNEAVRANLRFYENIFSQHDTMMPRERRLLNASRRYLTLEMLSMRHSPAFRGVSLYDEFYNSESMTAPDIVDLFFKAEEMSFRRRHDGLTSAEAKKALDRYVGRPADQRRYEDLEKFRAWKQHKDWEWGRFSRMMAGAAKDVMPSSRNFTLQRFGGSNGSNVALNGTPSEVFDPLDVASCVMYKDGGLGDRPVFAPMQADVLRIRPDIPVWTQLHAFHAGGLYGRHLLRQAFFGLGQGIQGFSFFTIDYDPRAPRQLDNRDTIRNIAGELTTPYGDLLMSLESGYKKVGIYYSRTADYLRERKPYKLTYLVEGLWVACMRAGYPADFLYDQDIRDGDAMDYDAIFAPGWSYPGECPPEIRAQLENLVNAGKVVAVDRASQLPIEGVTKLDSNLDEYDDKLGGAFPRYVDFESEMVWNRSEKTTELVKDFLSEHIEPAARHDALVGPDWLKSGKGHYMVMPNFAFTRFHGLYKTLYQAPDRPYLEFPERPSVCYDMLEMKRVPVEKDGDWMSMRADFRHYPGKIYAFLPAEIDRVIVRSTPRLTAGADLQFSVEVADDDGDRIDAGFPLEMTIVAPDGRRHHHVYRAATPVFRDAWRVPVNAPEGTWELQVRELISGTVGVAEVSVEGAEFPGGDLDERRVITHGQSGIKDLVSADEKPIIALDPDQEWVRPLAEKLRDSLTQMGYEAHIENVRDVVRLPAGWDRDDPTVDGTRMWRGTLVEPGLFVDRPVILLGRRRENRLIEAIIRRDAIPEPLTANFPGPGRAVLEVVPRAFSNHHSAALILSNDATGLRRGIEAFLRKDEVAGLPIHPKLVWPEEDENVELVAGNAAGRRRRSYRDAIQGEDLVRSLDVDPATGRVLVGTFGYGHNLFCFGADGKLLWKTLLPEHHVHYARWYDHAETDSGTGPARRVVAATARGYFVFLMDGASGEVKKKFSTTEWPNYHAGSQEFREGARTTQIPIRLNPSLRQILVRGKTQLLAVDYEGKLMWKRDRARALTAYPEEAEQAGAASFSQSIVLGGLKVSPDGSKLLHGEYEITGSTVDGQHIRNTWAHRPMILDARSGELLARNTSNVGETTRPRGWQLAWPADSESPLVRREQLEAPLRMDGTLGEFRSVPGIRLQNGDYLRRGDHVLERLTPTGKTRWQVRRSGNWVRHLGRLGSDGKRFYRCDTDGLVRCIDLSDGQVVWEKRLPFSARMFPVGQSAVAGTENGTVVWVNPDGTVRWRKSLHEQHEAPTNYPEYLDRALQRDRDATEEFYPVGRDRPGEYEDILRRGLEQLTNGGFEADHAWKSTAGQIHVNRPAHSGNRSALIAEGERVSQSLRRKVIPSATYLLEFFYRVDPDIEGPRPHVVAGALLGANAEEDAELTVSTFTADGPLTGRWRFGRLAVKTMAKTTSVTVGLEAVGGAVRVDEVSFTPIRFPSANLLASDELHAIEPTYVEDIRVQYDRIPGSLRNKLMHRNHVAAFPQAVPNTAIIWTQEQAFLHNGRLDDVGQMWRYQPDNMGFSVVLKKPGYVSHLAIYLNNATPDNVYQTISILANDMERKMPRQVALVRGNRKRFVLVHFDEPVYTDNLKILPGPHRAHRECITEIEVYGPPGGPEMVKKGRAFPGQAPRAWPMFMGGPSHAVRNLPQDLVGKYVQVGRMRANPPAHRVGGTTSAGAYTYGDPNGHIRSAVVPETMPEKRQRNRGKRGPTWSLATVTPLGTPARYAGRLLIGSADYKMHAVGDNGLPLWSHKTGGRIYSSPVPDGDEVYFGSDDGYLYKVDIDSGMLIWQFETQDRIRSSPALVNGRLYVASWDGHLYAVDAETGSELWQSPLARYTSGSPAVRDGIVYIGDERGQMHAFRAENGARVWQEKLDGRISACPLVTPEGVLFCAENGQLAMLESAGKVKWKRELQSRVSGQPIATSTQLVFATDDGLKVLRQSDGRPDERFESPGNSARIEDVTMLGDRVCLLASRVNVDEIGSQTFTEYHGSVVIWAPAPEQQSARNQAK